MNSIPQQLTLQFKWRQGQGQEGDEKQALLFWSGLVAQPSFLSMPAATTPLHLAAVSLCQETHPPWVVVVVVVW
jgi:hypothetical protein